MAPTSDDLNDLFDVELGHPFDDEVEGVAPGHTNDIGGPERLGGNEGGELRQFGRHGLRVPVKAGDDDAVPEPEGPPKALAQLDVGFRGAGDLDLDETFSARPIEQPGRLEPGNAQLHADVRKRPTIEEVVTSSDSRLFGLHRVVAPRTFSLNRSLLAGGQCEAAGGWNVVLARFGWHSRATLLLTEPLTCSLGVGGGAYGRAEDQAGNLTGLSCVV